MLDIGLFFLRLSFGGVMIFFHGWPKLINFTELSLTFADPLNIGSKISLVLVIFAEVFCAGALVVGLFTRLASIPLFTTMLVALLKVHALDPWSAKMLPLLYAFAFFGLMFTGGGRLAISEIFKK